MYFLCYHLFIAIVKILIQTAYLMYWIFFVYVLYEINCDNIDLNRVFFVVEAENMRFLIRGSSNETAYSVWLLPKISELWNCICED